jgi:hypothetical protein
MPRKMTLPAFMRVEAKSFQQHYEETIQYTTEEQNDESTNVRLVESHYHDRTGFDVEGQQFACYGANG